MSTWEDIKEDDSGQCWTCGKNLERFSNEFDCKRCQAKEAEADERLGK